MSTDLILRSLLRLRMSEILSMLTTTHRKAIATSAIVVALFAVRARAQVDQLRAQAYFKEVSAVCAREGGRIWGVPLCGPLALVDPTSRTMATNVPAPTEKAPGVFGYANMAMEWGGQRWSSVVWPMIPDDPHARDRLFIHELFHRLQPQLGFVLRDAANDHLDTVDGRYWLQLEWRALARALAAHGAERVAFVRDAVTFRARRTSLFAGSLESERLLIINEGLAQYTGTLAAAPTHAAAVDDAIAQLANAPLTATFVRTFPYALGAAYGLFLDDWSPGWPRRIHSSDDLVAVAMRAGHVVAGSDADIAALRYGGVELRQFEGLRDQKQQANVAAMRKRFVDGPLVIVPRAPVAAFVTSDMTPVPPAGNVYSSYHTSDAPWGSLVAGRVLVSADQATLVVPAPFKRNGNKLEGDEWTLELAPNWTVKEGTRAGDFIVVKSPI